MQRSAYWHEFKQPV